MTEYDRLKAQKEDILRRQRKQSESEAVRLLRDESQDMWIFEDGGDCLGVTEYSHYLERTEKDEGAFQEGERYVRYSDLEAALSRPPGPDWRKLAMNLWASLREYTDCTHTPTGTVDLNWCTVAMEAIRVALASESTAGKGGE